MNYLTDKLETNGAFVRPTTRLGRKLIARCLRKPFPGELPGDEKDRFAGIAAGEFSAVRMMDAMKEWSPTGDERACIPFFCDEARDGYGSRAYHEIFDRLRLEDRWRCWCQFYGIKKETSAWPRYFEIRGGACFSRVLARKTWHHSQAVFEFEMAQKEQEECAEIATHPGWRITNKDKATAETLRAAAKREREKQQRHVDELRNVWRDRERKELDRMIEVMDTFRGSPQRRSRRSKRAQLRALGITA